jgi:ribosomal protein S13
MKKFLTAMSIVLGLGFATAQQVAPATKTTTTKTVKLQTKDIKKIRS